MEEHATHARISYKRLADFDPYYLRTKVKAELAWDDHKYDCILEEFKKFICLCGATSTPFEMHNDDVDKLWHQFILFTREYAAFCRSYFDRFIHHTPHVSGYSEPADHDTFHEAYGSAFGEISELWLSCSPGNNSSGRSILTGAKCKDCKACKGCRNIVAEPEEDWLFLTPAADHSLTRARTTPTE